MGASLGAMAAGAAAGTATTGATLATGMGAGTAGAGVAAVLGSVPKILPVLGSMSRRTLPDAWDTIPGAAGVAPAAGGMTGAGAPVVCTVRRSAVPSSFLAREFPAALARFSSFLTCSRKCSVPLT